jgi:hypothetical protein
MISLNQIKQLSDDAFKRTVGISKEDFQTLLVRLEQLINEEKEKWPLKKRGIKGSLSVEEQLLLSIYYLRHYATFMILGQFFGVSESRCYKIYKKITDYLMKILCMPNRKLLMDDALKSIAIDVTEQRIERPGQHQKDYYSGKKNTILSKCN